MCNQLYQMYLQEIADTDLNAPIKEMPFFTVIFLFYFFLSLLSPPSLFLVSFERFLSLSVARSPLSLRSYVQTAAIQVIY